MKRLTFAAIIVGCSFEIYGQTKSPLAQIGIQGYSGTGSVTRGLGKTMVENVFVCKQERYRIAPVGEITDLNGKIWVLPASNNFTKADKAFDLYNECIAVVPNNLSEVNLKNVPVAEIDKNGDVITGFLFADNYFELYVNGQLIAVDPVPFTPFNSNVVRFKVKKPYTIAVKLIDWEEKLGLGSESGGGVAYHSGDGGFIASFSDGTVTDSKWKAQTFYTSPVKNLSCLSEEGQKRLSSKCITEDSNDRTDFFGVHWEVPKNIFDETFDDKKWPEATTYTEDEIGVNNKKGYMNFIEKFSGSGAKFIWSTNLILDNEVIVRYTVK